MNEVLCYVMLCYAHTRKERPTTQTAAFQWTCCDVREAKHIISNYEMEEGAAVEWLIQVLACCVQREVLSPPASEATHKSPRHH